MLHNICQSCGQPNADIARHCRYCGNLLQPAHDATRTGYAEPPTPQGSYTPSHDWASSAPLPPAPPTYAVPQTQTGAAFRCPYCQATAPPVVGRRISTGGWIVFAALLVFCLPLCFFGLFIKEEYPMCSWCRASLS